VLQLRVFGPAAAMRALADDVSALPGATHVVRSDAGDHADRALVTVDLDPEAADAALGVIQRRGIPPEDVWLLRLEGFQPGRRGPAPVSVVWADLIGLAREYARPVVRYLVFMAVAGVIAAYGVIYSNEILIVGAMAVSPDFLPIAATCIGLVALRIRLAARSFFALTVGLATASLTAGLLTVLLDVLDLLPSSFHVGENGLSGLTTINSSTVVVALAAGIAGMLALETRASAAVGVAISVTTIPASAYLGVAAAEGEVGKAAGALAVLGINVGMLLVGGSLTLIVQRMAHR
jgi:uncharacterized hydrophobic protein (TIGR00271 family)